MADFGARDPLAGARSGRLEGTSVPELLWGVCSSGATGILSVRSGAVTKRLYVREGRIVFASSTDPDDRLGEFLLREGRISLDALEEATGRLEPGKRLGTLLVEAGHLSPQDLVRSVLGQVEEIVLGLFDWQEGDYCFEEGPLPSEEVITLGIRTEDLLRRGIRRTASFSRMRANVGGPRTAYRLRPGSRDKLEGAALADAERLVLERLARGVATVETLCREVLLSNFEIYQALWAFRITGIVEEADAPAADSAPTVLEGRLDGEGFPALLVLLGRAGETGLLHVCRGLRERTFHLEGGRCLFATSDSLDDGLVSYLLRRGVISVRDRERVARQLLRNRRAGQLLCEMGAIGEAELAGFVREHLLEIVHTTFLWTEGSWAFQRGPLPTEEPIVLDVSLEKLVAGGIRRVRSVRRAREAVGGPDMLLALTPDYLSILDRMEIGNEEWEVVSSLREPRTVREICRESKLGAFEVYRLLWTLKLLGAVREAERPQAVVLEEEAEGRGPAPEQSPYAAECSPVPEAVPEDGQGVGEPRVSAEREVSAGPTEESSCDAEGAERETGSMPWGLVAEDPGRTSATACAGDEVSPDATVAIPRAEIESALSRPAEGEGEGPPSEGSAPTELEEPRQTLAQPSPKVLDRAIALFNEKHRTVYRVIRSEIGAGALNFVRSCRGTVASRLSDRLAAVELLADGTWDESGLKRALLEQTIAEPGQVLDQLLEEELARLAALVGEARARSLRERIRSLDGAATASS